MFQITQERITHTFSGRYLANWLPRKPVTTTERPTSLAALMNSSGELRLAESLSICYRLTWMYAAGPFLITQAKLHICLICFFLLENLFFSGQCTSQLNISIKPIMAN
eukprot:gnl/MRDRNA2_/MRDRNA2_254013_c0_seq1.p1 gnl/MRDRNA2_/MRDRNA2_254013_c0~~gnl/MRDRNA2_/MRDRNA2_254013_c0_seq1.p1  ORF type:complete len:108 (-),score=3.03 gnl/MRDRNA2_/MRDRNA2_254013_c0_seq1:214-537(-)